MANPSDHPSDEGLAEFNSDGQWGGRRVRAHLQSCEACRQRREQHIRLRELLAESGQRERRPLRNHVPSAMMRLRLRRHSVTNANELLEGFVAFVRGLATLFTLPLTDERVDRRQRGGADEKHG